MNKTFVIAEIGQAHDGSLGILHSYIDAISTTGVDAIKFQTHIAEAESSEREKFRVNFSYEDKSRFAYWKRMSFSKEQWLEIKKHCDDVGLEFMSSPFSVAAVELLESIGMKRYKIGSGEITNFLMLDRIANTKNPIILSSGMSSLTELESSIDFLKPYGNELSILQCTTSYPTSSDRVGLNVIEQLKNNFKDISIGLSDHSGTIYPGIAAVALGASIVEFHVVFDKQMFGPDAMSSLNLLETTSLVNGIRFIENTINNPVDKNDISNYSGLKSMFGKSLSVNKDLPVGHTISKMDLESKKPMGEGVSARDFESVIGRKLKSAKLKYEFLNYSDLIERR